MQKIVSRDYFDLDDLLPEQLLSTTSPNNNTVVILPESAYATQRRKKRHIPDIATWVQVYSTYMLVLGSAFPDQLLELIAYQLLIVQHSKRFEYPSWLRYDVEFRQWAGLSHFHNWSQIHPQFYALAFTAQGKSTDWCPICYTDGGNHAYDCPKFSPPSSSNTPRFAHHQQSNFRPSFSVSPPAMYPPPWQPRPYIPADPRPPPPKRPNPEYCILYNKHDGNCPYGARCIKAHLCAYCRKKGHPVSRCPSKTV